MRRQTLGSVRADVERRRRARENDKIVAARVEVLVTEGHTRLCASHLAGSEAFGGKCRCARDAAQGVGAV